MSIAEPVSRAVDLPVAMSHDVRAAGLAEWRHGAGAGVDDLLVVTIGTGIAATVIASGNLVTGGLGRPGELAGSVPRRTTVVAVPDVEPAALGSRSGVVGAALRAVNPIPRHGAA